MGERRISRICLRRNIFRAVSVKLADGKEKEKSKKFIPWCLCTRLMPSRRTEIKVKTILYLDLLKLNTFFVTLFTSIIAKGNFFTLEGLYTSSFSLSFSTGLPRRMFARVNTSNYLIFCNMFTIFGLFHVTIFLVVGL